MRQLLRLAAVTSLLVAALAASGQPVRAAVKPLVWDLRALVWQDDVNPNKPGPESVAALMWSPPTPQALAAAGMPIGSYPYCGPEMKVYRHDRTSGRNISLLVSGASKAFLYKASSTAPWEVRGGTAQSPCSQAAPAGWDVDPLYGYVRFKDTNAGLGLTDYEEYYYLVWTSGDGTTLYQDYLSEYVITAAFPPTQTRHGNFSEYTNACTACHGLHSAKHPKLLKGPTVTDLCGTCHDGTGSKYDEVRGYVRLGPSWKKRAFAAAGPFGDQLKAGSGIVTTAVHNVFRLDGPDWARVWQAPGSGFTKYTYDNTPDTDASATKDGEPSVLYISNQWYSKLVCSSCHEPHNRSRNYRILRGVYNDWTKVVVRGFSEVNTGYAASDQDPNDPTTCVGDTCDPVSDRGDWSERAMYTKFLYGTERFCVGCHRAFLSSDAAGRYPNTPGDQPLDTAAGASVSHIWGGHRHAIGLAAKRAANYPIDGVWMVGSSPCGMDVPNENTNGDRPCGQQSGVTDPVLPLQGRAAAYADNVIVCLTCHVPHGSGSERIEVAYRNDGANMTQQADRDPVSGYLYNRADRVTAGGPVPAVDDAVYSRWVDLNRNGVRDPGETDGDPMVVTKETPVSPGRDLDGDGTVECTAVNPAYPASSPQTECPTEGAPGVTGDEWPRLDLYLPNDVPYWTQFGFSSALARFNPFAQVCYRCHGLRTPNQ